MVTRVNISDLVPEPIVVFKIPDILISVASMQVIVVNFKQKVLFKSYSFAVNDTISADIAFHLPYLFQLFLVFYVALLPTFGFVEVEGPFYGQTVAIDFVEKSYVCLLHLSY